ncbi:MAG: hypothetical protein ACPGJS_10220 [Flammeovirgaceae bacterium]
MRLLSKQFLFIILFCILSTGCHRDPGFEKLDLKYAKVGNFNDYIAPNGVWEVLLVCTTSESSIKQSAKSFLHYATKETKTMAKLLNLKLNITVLEGNDVNPHKVRSTIKEMIAKKRPAGAQKYMFSMLSFTHGLNYKETHTPIPFMLCHPTKRTVANHETNLILSLDQLYKDLRENSAYDHIHVWAELCDKVPNGCEVAPQVSLLDVTTKGRKGENLKKLLFSVKSEIMVSSSYGQASCAEASGGFFSRSLFNAINEVATSSISAKFEGAGGVFEHVTNNTVLYSQMIPNSSCVGQTPQCYVEDRLPSYGTSRNSGSSWD